MNFYHLSHFFPVIFFFLDFKNLKYALTLFFVQSICIEYQLFVDVLGFGNKMSKTVMVPLFWIFSLGRGSIEMGRKSPSFTSSKMHVFLIVKDAILNRDTKWNLAQLFYNVLAYSGVLPQDIFCILLHGNSLILA